MLFVNLFLTSGPAPWWRVVFLHRSSGAVVDNGIPRLDAGNPTMDPYGLEQPFANRFGRPKLR